MKNSWGMIVLCLWLILMGAVLVLNMSFDWQRFILGGMAIAAGVLLLLGK